MNIKANNQNTCVVCALKHVIKCKVLINFGYVQFKCNHYNHLQPTYAITINKWFLVVTSLITIVLLTGAVCNIKREISFKSVKGIESVTTILIVTTPLILWNYSIAKMPLAVKAIKAVFQQYNKLMLDDDRHSCNIQYEEISKSSNFTVLLLAIVLVINTVLFIGAYLVFPWNIFMVLLNTFSFFVELEFMMSADIILRIGMDTFLKILNSAVVVLETSSSISDTIETLTKCRRNYITSMKIFKAYNLYVEKIILFYVFLAILTGIVDVFLFIKALLDESRMHTGFARVQFRLLVDMSALMYLMVKCEKCRRIVS